MSSVVLTELPYSANSADLFSLVADEPWAIFLDSGWPASTYGRYDIITARPNVRLTACEHGTKIETWSDSITVPDDMLVVINEYLSELRTDQHDLPFVGGALGYFSYDFGRTIEKIPSSAVDDMHLPSVMFGIYSWAVIVDHKMRKAFLVGNKNDTKTRREWSELKKLFVKRKTISKSDCFRAVSAVQSNFSKDAYADAFKKIKNYIKEGDCYQVNLAQRFNVQIDGSPWQAYQKLRTINPSPFSAYMHYPNFQILSNSPERFLSLRDRVVQTKPIKGTRPRNDDSNKDLELLNELAQSKKDQAENVMIVDLLRNDISKNCALGSVQVPKLFDIESYPNVHHMVSTINGQLRDGRTALDLLRGCFPGGSITGAPKVRAMEIIEELEPHRRGIYCGSIGYISFDGKMDTNIAIRTILHKDRRMYFYAGGGIVYDSDVDAEYQETYDKASAIMQLFEKGSSCALGN